MAGIVAGTILALMAGLVLIYGYRVWRTNLQAVELQRDGTIAMMMMGRGLREATGTNVVVSGSRITIGTNAFYRQGNHFLYDRDTTHTGGEVMVITGKVAALTLVRTNTCLSVRLMLRDGGEQTTLDGTWAFRN